MLGRIRTTFVAVLVPALALAIGGAVLTPTASWAGGASAPSSPYSVITENVRNSNDPSAGASYLFDSGNSTFTATEYSGGVSLHAANSTSGDGITVSISGELHNALGTGTFPIANTLDDTHVSAQVNHGSVGCTVHGGSVTVTELATDPSHNPTAYAATYDILCDTFDFTGELRYQSSMGYVADSITTDNVDWSPLTVGALTPVKTWTLTSLGSQTLVVSTVAITGDTPAAFVVDHDNCTGQSLTYGQTCTVQLAGRPTEGGLQTANLSFTDNEASSPQIALLQVVGQATEKGSYAPVDPQRVLDTRTSTGGHHRKVGAGEAVGITLPYENISAVVLNVTVTGETAKSGYLTAYAAGTTRPTASNINYTKGVSRAGLITVPVSSAGKLWIYNSSGSVDVIADWEGAYIGGTSSGSFPTKFDYFPTASERIIDTREKSSGVYGGLPSGYEIPLTINYGTEWHNATGAFVLNVTAVSPKASGYLTAYNIDVDPSRTSTVNFRAGKTTANLAIVPSEVCQTKSCKGLPMIRIFNGSSKKTNFIVDVVGFYGLRSVAEGLRFTPMRPIRIVDTRSSVGTTKLGADQQKSVTAPTSVAGYDTFALSMNVTAVSPSASTYLTLWPDGDARPGVSNLNVSAGATLANAAMVEVGPGNIFDIYNHAGSTNAVIDVSGRFDQFPSTNPHPFVAGVMPANPTLDAVTKVAAAPKTSIGQLVARR